MKTLVASVLFLATAFVAGCGGRSGWPQSVKDGVIAGCVKEAKANASDLNEAKLNNYCSCYQQNLEKRFPDPAEMKKVGPQDLTVEAQKCIELMFQ